MTDMKTKLQMAALEIATRQRLGIAGLSIIDARIDDVMDEIEAGVPARKALIDNFDDRLLDHLLKAIGEPKA